MVTVRIEGYIILLSVPQEDEWQINEAYMDNIAKYPKDWYKQMTQKKKWTSQPENLNKKPEKSVRSSQSSQRASKEDGKAEVKAEDAASEKEENEAVTE